MASILELAAGGCSLLPLVEKLLLSLCSSLKLEMKGSGLVFLFVDLFHKERVGSPSFLSSIFEDGLFSESSFLQFLLELLLFSATSLLALEFDGIVSLQDSIMLSDKLLSFVRLSASRLVVLQNLVVDVLEPFLVL